MAGTSDVLVQTKGLCKYFPVAHGKKLKAVDDVSVTVRRGECLGVVGESGCGKTTFARTVAGIYSPTSGEVLFDGSPIGRLKGPERKAFSKRVQTIFQDPYASLDASMRVYDIVCEGLRAHGLVRTREERKAKAAELLEKVGLPASCAERYAHEFSGGQRQRIGIARAISLGPELVVCDEPISALDVSVQAQIVNLLESMREESRLTYLFIAHDLSMVRHISDRVMVMYLGRVVEIGSTAEIFQRTLHPYTKALMSAIPIPDPDVEMTRERIKLGGEPVSPIDPPGGCLFASRCPHASERCQTERPNLAEVRPGHLVACHLCAATTGAGC